MVNEHNKNKRVYPSPCIVSPKSIPIALPPADTGTTGGKGPGQDGWESVDGVVVGPVQHNFDEKLQAGLAAIEAMNNEGPIQQTLLWPDGGMNKPSQSSHIIYPSENDQPAQPTKKIHSFGLSEDFEMTSIDRPATTSQLEDLARRIEDAVESAGDDQNDWGGIERLITEGIQNINRDEIGVDAEDTKYGPGNYPEDGDTSYRTPEFYHNVFTEDKPLFKWMVPGLLAIGEHPIFSSHQEDLSAFKAAGFKAVVTCFDKQLDPKYLKGFHYLFAPTVQGFSGDLRMICRFIDTQFQLDNPVFIHSFTGKGRAATVMAAYLVHRGWLTSDEAIEWVRQNYNATAIETVAQEDAVLQYGQES